MKLDREGFLVRYYEWAAEEWEWEISSGLSRLSSLPSRSLQRAAIALGRYSRDEQRVISRALRKRFHPEACQLAGEPLTVDERALLGTFDSARLAEPLESPPERIDHKALRRHLREGLTSLCGAGPDSAYETGAEWRHLQELGRIRVVTYIDTGGRSRQAEYTHDIEDADGEKVVRLISLASWLGLGTTTFNRISAGAERQASDQMIDLCRHFLAAAPILFPEAVG